MAGDRFMTAVMLLCEAESEGIECQEWTVWTVYNRWKSGRFAKTMAACIAQRMQFSEFNDDRADNANLLRVLSMDDHSPRFMSALAVYDNVMQQIESGIPDPTNGSTHFYADSITPPGWSGPPAVFRGQKGKVRFYSNVP